MYKLNKLFVLTSVIGLVTLAPVHATDLNNKPRHIFHKKDPLRSILSENQ